MTSSPLFITICLALALEVTFHPEGRHRHANRI
jgi:hypothetical protein